MGGGDAVTIVSVAKDLEKIIEALDPRFDPDDALAPRGAHEGNLTAAVGVFETVFATPDQRQHGTEPASRDPKSAAKQREFEQAGSLEAVATRRQRDLDARPALFAGVVLQRLDQAQGELRAQVRSHCEAADRGSEGRAEHCALASADEPTWQQRHGLAIAPQDQV